MTKSAERIATARNIIFKARAIVAVTAAAAMSELPADRHATEVALECVAEMLGDAADMLDER